MRGKFVAHGSEYHHRRHHRTFSIVENHSLAGGREHSALILNYKSRVYKGLWKRSGDRRLEGWVVGAKYSTHQTKYCTQGRVRCRNTCTKHRHGDTDYGMVLSLAQRKPPPQSSL